MTLRRHAKRSDLLAGVSGESLLFGPWHGRPWPDLQPSVSAEMGSAYEQPRGGAMVSSRPMDLLESSLLQSVYACACISTRGWICVGVPASPRAADRHSSGGRHVTVSARRPATFCSSRSHAPFHSVNASYPSLSPSCFTRRPSLLRDLFGGINAPAYQHRLMD